MKEWFSDTEQETMWENDPQENEMGRPLPGDSLQGIAQWGWNEIEPSILSELKKQTLLCLDFIVTGTYGL